MASTDLTMVHSSDLSGIYIYMSKEQNTPYHTVVFGRSLEIIWHAFNARLWKTIRSDVCMGYAV